MFPFNNQPVFLNLLSSGISPAFFIAYRSCLEPIRTFIALAYHILPPISLLPSFSYSDIDCLSSAQYIPAVPFIPAFASLYSFML